MMKLLSESKFDDAFELIDRDLVREQRNLFKVREKKIKESAYESNEKKRKKKRELQKDRAKTLGE